MRKAFDNVLNARGSSSVSKSFAFLLVVALLSGCRPAANEKPATEILPVVAASEAATPTTTIILGPTFTKAVTETPVPTNTLVPTDTPKPTRTPVPISLPVPTDAVSARVVRVLDGDEIEVELDGKLRMVRYIGVDAPVIANPQAPCAPFTEGLKRNTALVSGKVVQLEKDGPDMDEYDRLLRQVWVDGILVSAELLRLGYGQVSTHLPSSKYREFFLQLERQAYEDKLGLWKLGLACFVQ